MAITDDSLHVAVNDEERKRRKKEKKERKARKSEQDAEAVQDSQKKKRKRDEDNSKDSKVKRKRPSLDLESTPIATETSTPVAAPSQAEVDAFLAEHSIKIDSTVPITPIIFFSQLDIPSSLSASLTGFTSPTPIQACTWPPALDGKDVVGIAETGSGKTLAFGIPALFRLVSHHQPCSSKQTPISILILAPTRELALQTHSTLSSLAAPFSIASVCLFGGVPKEPQVKTLRNLNKDGMKTRIVVGTPGRVLDLVREGVCDLSQITYLVLDEADRMLDKGFENDIRSIISYTKQGADRQTMMFSATWPEAVRRLASTFLQNPVRVTVGSDDLTANSRVRQILEVFDDAHSKDTRLLSQLRSLSHKKTTKTGSSESRILIFALYKKEASRVEMMLRRQGYAVGALHGDMSQQHRMDALQAFRDGTTGLLVATDVAARGLDIPNVGAVINYTFPLTIEDYIHRIGRTGRGGRTGKSITFFTGENHERALAGELARVLREGGFGEEADALKKFPMTIKKKTHSVYGAFYREDIPPSKGPTKITF